MSDKEPEKTLVLGYPKFARFNMLKISIRNCALPFSPKNGSAVSFTTEKSHSPNPGPRSMFREELPRYPRGGKVNISGLNQFLGSPVVTFFDSNGIKVY